MSALLVGQAPARSGTGSPWDSDAGRRLARYMGVTHEDLLATFEPTNLNERRVQEGKYDRFDTAEGREAALRLAQRQIDERPWDVILLCGVAVSRCFGVEPPYRTIMWGAEVFAIHHPAGTSMWWNDPGNRALGERLARAAWEQATLAGAR